MEIGSIVAGKHRIDRLIGEGGMATIVATTPLALGTQLALKFLDDEIKGSVSMETRSPSDGK